VFLQQLITIASFQEQSDWFIMSSEHLFSSSRDVIDISDCYFYHVMDLPDYGEVGSEWDLRGGEEAYLGGVSFQAKRVLELGTASGFLCHYMEGKGADVIGFDLASDRSWDLVPFAGLDLPSFRVERRNHIERLKNGWWFAHRLFGSQAKVIYGNIYDIPEEIGLIDIATFGLILCHLRDPFQALHSALRLTQETVVVTEWHPEQPVGSGQNMSVSRKFASGLRKYLKRLLAKIGVISDGSPRPGAMYFVPNSQGSDLGAEISTWWCLSPEVICRFLGVLGFADQVVTEHFQTLQGKRIRLYTVVGKRTQKI
jgi:methyltransferase family protein